MNLIEIADNLSDGAMEIVLSFSLSELLFLITEKLLKEVYEEKEIVWHTSASLLDFFYF